MKNLLLSVFILSSSLYGLDVDDVISKALESNPSLQAINQRITANKANIKLSTQFANPTVSYSQNTIDSDQAMSRQTLTFSQKIPYFGKRDSLKDIAIAEEAVLAQNLTQAKVMLATAIKTQAYTIWELENLLDIISSYEDLTKQNIQLYQSYTSTSDNQHMGIMSAELTLSDLSIQKNTLESRIASAYARISYLGSFEITKLDTELAIIELPNKKNLKKSLSNNRELFIKDEELRKNNAMIEKEKLGAYPDFNIVAGYSHRENFDNYATFGVGVTLPIYSTDEYKEEGARAEALVTQSLKADKEVEINSQFNAAFIQMKSSYEIYHIINDKSLPQLAHMFELANSSIATGGDLFKYIDILGKKLKLEEKSISATANYSRAEAKIAALSGEI